MAVEVRWREVEVEEEDSVYIGSIVGESFPQIGVVKWTFGEARGEVESLQWFVMKVSVNLNFIYF